MRKHIPALDGVRGLAILMVMAFHLRLIVAGVPGWLGRISPIGQTGVTLFFVLSGFLITRILLQARAGKHYFSHFYLRRAFRILPLYYAFLAYYCYLAPHLVHQASVPLSQSWWCWVYLQNIPESFMGRMAGPEHYWSLAVEEHFYLLWPLIVWKGSRRTLNWVCLGLVAMAVSLQAPLAAAGVNTFFFTLTRVDGLALGALLAINEVWLMERRLAMVRLFGAGIVVFGVLLGIGFFHYSGVGSPAFEVWKYPAISLFFGCVVGLAATSLPTEPACLLLGWAPLRFFGMISFGLYVLHYDCYWLVLTFTGIGGPWWVAYLVCVAAAVAVALASYRFFETPFLRLKQRYEPKGVPIVPTEMQTRFTAS